jgi:hypothetical protein
MSTSPHNPAPPGDQNDSRSDEREPGTRPDGEALPPDAIDPAPHGSAIPPLPEPDVEGVGEESGPSADTTKV